jgi:hypothetical protein
MKRYNLRRAARALLALSALLWLLVPALRHLVEASMSLHMLLQFPLLLAAGWAAAGWLPRRLAARLGHVDGLGLSSATLASCVSAFWMIPAALDLAVLDGWVALLKYLSWLLAGLLLAEGWQRLGGIPATYFLGNAAWMLITAGLLYRDAESRLCVSYLFDEQSVSGNGLVAWGLALGGLALLKLRTLLRQAEQASA